jgi:hypothetical protein
MNNGKTLGGAKESHALAVFDRHLAETGERLTRHELQKMANVSYGTAARAVTFRDHEEEARKGLQAVLSTDQRREFLRLVEGEKRRLEEQFRIRVAEAAEEWVFEHRFPRFAKRIEDADRIVKAHRGVWTEAEYRTVLHALHPDVNPSPRAAEAFNLVRQAEAALKIPDEVKPLSAALPRSRAALMRMREEMQRKQAAVRAARSKARKNGTDLPVP